MLKKTADLVEEGTPYLQSGVTKRVVLDVLCQNEIMKKDLYFSFDIVSQEDLFSQSNLINKL